ncbi:MAG: response regulator [Thermodesulfobacteriota bacterium]|nr:response regulator [Thermodesulfobacteriota bacterium]
MKPIEKKSGYFQRFKAFAISRMAPGVVVEKDSLTYWRVYILFAIILTGVIIGIFALVPVAVMLIKEKMWALLAFDWFVWLMGMYLLLSNRLRYEIRAAIALMLVYGLGLVIIINVGPLSGGPAWLFAFAVLMGILLGARAAMAGLAINAITLTILYWLISAGFFGQTFPFFNTMIAMIVAGANFVLLNAIAAISVAVLVKGLASTHDAEKSLNRTLKTERLYLMEAKKKLEHEVEERLRVENVLRESEEKEKLRNRIANIFLTKTDEQMYWEVLTIVLHIMKSKFGVFGYINQQGALVCPSMTRDIWDQCQMTEKDIVFPRDTWGNSIWGKGLRTKKSAYANKPFKVPQGHIPIDRCLTVPIVFKDRSIGVLTVANKTEDYVKSDKIVLESVAEYIAPVLHAILERKQAEKELQESNEKLARSKKMESLGLMAGGIAHDLNNILSGIVSYPDLLLMDLPADSPIREPVEVIKESGERAADVVSDLLTVARGVATGKEVINLNALVEEYLNSAEYQQINKTHPSVYVEAKLDEDLLNIHCSPTHIKKSLMNLVANASESIEDGGTITISTINRYLDEPLKGYEDVRTGEYAMLTVSDDGSGISSQDLERIFEPFYTKKIMGRSGTGLGLAVVWNTVQDCDGYINIRSNENGTVFELYFPVTRDESRLVKQDIPFEDYVGHGEKILVVDDEENQREIASRLLIKLGYTTEAVLSGEKAVEYLKENSVDLIVLDMIMPNGMNGHETYREIIKIHPGQKAIIASGFAETEDVKAAQKLGAGKYIKKPYTIEKIGLAVKEELEAGSRLRSET